LRTVSVLPGSLLAAGTSICGVTAVSALAPGREDCVSL
jgi:uncharacterized membrane protein YadS